jgi:hypothetical protein
MNICKPLFTIIVASMLSGLAPQVIAGSNGSNQGSDDDCNTRITSTTIKIVDQKAFWQLSGRCMDKIAKISLAMDDGDGFEDFVYPEFEKSPTSLTIPVVPRSGGIVGGLFIGEHVISAGQYLLQAKSCKPVRGGDKCKIEDETFIPVVGDQKTIDTLIAIDTKIQSNPLAFIAKIKALFGL